MKNLKLKAKKKRVIAGAMALVMAASLMVGCGGKTAGGKSADGKVKISFAEYPTDSDKDAKKVMDDLIESYKQKYPDVDISGDHYTYSVQTFLPLASSGQLPTIYRAYYTEVDKIIDSGYALDLTEALKKHGYADKFSEDAKELVTRDGKMYALPQSIYGMGLAINVDLFKRAGLVDDEGYPIVPETYDELLETAKIIKEKTGAAGFAIPTMNNNGGWYFMNLAWSMGVKFMEQDSDGNWKATFASKECEEALKFIRDMKWVHNVLPENTLLNTGSIEELYSTDKVAMTFAAKPIDVAATKYGADLSKLSFYPVPRGSAGRYALIGGSIWFIRPDATDEQVDACLNWMKHRGVSPEATEENKKTWADNYEVTKKQGGAVGYDGLSIWKEDSDYLTVQREVRKPYENVDSKLFPGPYGDGVEFRSEEPMSAQQLYTVFDSLLQEILTNENADIPALLEKAQADFQKDSL